MENSLKKRKKRMGFTLIELIIVLAVMGIIALIAIPSLMGTKENFRIKADKKSCETIKRAVDILIADETIPEDAQGDIIAEYSKVKVAADDVNKTPAKEIGWNITNSLTITETDTNKNTAIKNAITTAIKNELEDNKGPQEKNKIKYKIKIVVDTTTKKQSVTVATATATE